MRLSGLNLVVRNSLEFAVIYGLWRLEHELVARQSLTLAGLTALVLVAAWAKTLFFGIENIRQLWRASAENMPYYKFLLLMLVNMLQIVISFALDFELLHRLSSAAFGGVNPELAGGAVCLRVLLLQLAELHVLRLRRHHPADHSREAAHAQRNLARVRYGDLPAVGLHQPEGVDWRGPQ